MSDADEDPRCPECGEPIGVRATYCMHCSADLTAERAAADADGDGAWDRSTAETEDGPDAGGDYDVVDVTAASASTADERRTELLDPDGVLDDTLTVLVGILGGVVVGVVGTLVLLIVTGSGWALGFGLAAWLIATAYLVRRRTVQGALAKSGYAVALVLLAVPLVALSPVVDVDGGPGERAGLFLTLVLFVALPAGVAAGVGWLASRYVPGDAGGSEG